MFKKIILFINFFFIKFFCCLLVAELSIIKKRIEYLKYFLKEVDIIKFVIYLFDKKTYPFKSLKFQKFIKKQLSLISLKKQEKSKLKMIFGYYLR